MAVLRKVKCINLLTLPSESSRFEEILKTLRRIQNPAEDLRWSFLQL